MTEGSTKNIVQGYPKGEPSRYISFDYSSSGTQASITLEEWNRVTIGMSLTSGAVMTYTMQVQLDDTGAWFDSAVVNSQSDSITVLEGHVKNIRLNITSYTSGTITFEILQSG